MKIKISISFLLLSVGFSASAQDAIKILKGSYVKCQLVQNGYYEAERTIIATKDTVVCSFHCYFRKLENDPVSSSAFHYKQYNNGEFLGEVLYTGNEFVRTWIKDSTAKILSNVLWADEIKSRLHDENFYTPLTNLKSSPLPHDSDYMDGKHFFKFVGEEMLNNIPCYHVWLSRIPADEGAGPAKVLSTECQIWISKSDSIPIKYSNTVHWVMNRDTMYQYIEQHLSKYEINNLTDQRVLTLNSIPSNYRLIDEVPDAKIKSLLKDTLAPGWKLQSLTGQEVSLADLRGKVVLIDFFYKGCYPCRLALPALQAFYEKYKEKGLTVIGIDPSDKKKDDLAAFLAKQGVTYTVLLAPESVVNNYRVSIYPTMYLIDRNGKIIYSQIGYAKDAEVRIEKVIRKVVGR